ncbi:hypothetical protein CsSME_00004351 [Camellia sinensis var. sinensis]
MDTKFAGKSIAAVHSGLTDIDQMADTTAEPSQRPSSGSPTTFSLTTTTSTSPPSTSLHLSSDAGKHLTKKIGLVYQLNIASKKKKKKKKKIRFNSRHRWWFVSQEKHFYSRKFAVIHLNPFHALLQGLLPLFSSHLCPENLSTATFASRRWPNFSNASFRSLSDVDHERPPTKQRYSTSSDIFQQRNREKSRVRSDVPEAQPRWKSSRLQPSPVPASSPPAVNHFHHAQAVLV